MEVHPCQPLISAYTSLWFIYTEQLPEAGAYLLHGLGWAPSPSCPCTWMPHTPLPTWAVVLLVSRSLISDKGLFLGNGMAFKGHSFLLQRELGDGKHSRALIVTPHACFFTSAFIHFWGSSAEPPWRHLIMNSVPSDWTSFLKLVPIILTQCPWFSSVNTFISQRSLGPGFGCPVPFLLSQSFLVHGVPVPSHLTLPISQFHTFSDITAGFPSSWSSCPSKYLLQPE